MATKKKEWSRRALCVGNQNKLRQSLWLHGNDKVTLAIKNLSFFFFLVNNTHVTQSTLFKRMEKLMENYEMCLYLPRAERQPRPSAHSDAAFGFFQLRVNLQV